MNTKKGLFGLGSQDLDLTWTWTWTFETLWFSDSIAPTSSSLVLCSHFQLRHRSSLADSTILHYIMYAHIKRTYICICNTVKSLHQDPGQLVPNLQVLMCPHLRSLFQCFSFYICLSIMFQFGRSVPLLHLPTFCPLHCLVFNRMFHTSCIFLNFGLHLLILIFIWWSSFSGSKGANHGRKILYILLNATFEKFSSWWLWSIHCATWLPPLAKSVCICGLMQFCQSQSVPTCRMSFEKDYHGSAGRSRKPTKVAQTTNQISKGAAKHRKNVIIHEFQDIHVQTDSDTSQNSPLTSRLLAHRPANVPVVEARVAVVWCARDTMSVHSLPRPIAVDLHKWFLLSWA